MGAKVWKRTDEGGSQTYVVGVQQHQQQQQSISQSAKYGQLPNNSTQRPNNPYVYAKSEGNISQMCQQAHPNSSSSSSTTNTNTNSNSNTINGGPTEGSDQQNDFVLGSQRQQTHFNLNSYNKRNGNYRQRQFRTAHAHHTSSHDFSGYVSNSCHQRNGFKNGQHSNASSHHFKQGNSQGRWGQNQGQFYFSQGFQRKHHVKQAQDPKMQEQQQKYEGMQEEVQKMQQRVKQLEEAIRLSKKRKAEQELNEHEERKQRLRTKLQRSFAKQFEQVAEEGQVKREAEERERQRQEVLRLIQRITQAKDPYEVLGVDRNVQDVDSKVRTSFKKLAVVLHPDKCSFEEATEAFQKVRSAYDTLQQKLVQ